VGAGAIAAVLFVKLERLAMLVSGLDPNTRVASVLTEYLAGCIVGSVFVWVAARVAPGSKQLAGAVATTITLFSVAAVFFSHVVVRTDRGELLSLGAALGALLVAYGPLRREASRHVA
jgi:hypothetical protein